MIPKRGLFFKPSWSYSHRSGKKLWDPWQGVEDEGTPRRLILLCSFLCQLPGAPSMPELYRIMAGSSSRLEDHLQGILTRDPENHFIC